MICNYHTHTKLCKHALGNIEDYIEEALSRNVECLGISDHTPLPDNRWLGVRMHIDELEDYSKSIDDAKLKYQGKIRILKGMECDWAPEYADFYDKVLLKKYKFDYLIGASHWFPYNNEWQLSFNITESEQVIAYAKFYAEGIASRLFALMAHPDVFRSKYEWDEKASKAAEIILEAAQKYNIPLEINGYGFRKPQTKLPNGIKLGYPCEKFWQMAGNYDIKVFCNSDAHLPTDVIDGIAEARKIAAKYGLKEVTFDL